MKIRWFAHACFLLQAAGLRIITDPYVPEVMGYGYVTEPADVVIRNSADDAGHANAAMISGDPVVITATEIPKLGRSVRGLNILAIRAQESLIHKEDPGINAMYRFALDGIRFGHLGDVGNRLTRRQLAGLAGVEVMLVPSGGPPTIELQDISEAIRSLRPRLAIPMHYGIPGGKVKMLPVSDFAGCFKPSEVRWVDGPEIQLTRATLPRKFRIMILNPSTADNSGDQEELSAP